jgi:sugar phosphate isomerase/epimerase
MQKIAFNTANLVARTTNYRFSLQNWMDQHQKTVAATDAREWGNICADIAEAGYKSVEIWQAHADPSVMTPAKAKVWREILDNHDLQPIRGWPQSRKR